MEEFKSLPFSSVWNKLCLNNKVPVGADWLKDVQKYEEQVLSGRAKI
jgi:L-rhamnose isomerase